MDKIQEYIDKGLIPNHPEVIRAIKDGEVDIEDIATQFAKQTNRPRQQFGIPSADEQADKLLQKDIENDLIPGHPDVIKAIKSGEVSIDDIKKQYAILKKNQETLTINSKDKEINKPEDVYNSAIAEIKHPENIVRTDPTTGLKKKSIFENYVDSAKQDLNRGIYYVKKFSEGLTFDIYDTPDESVDTTSAIVGTVSKLAGYGVSGWLGGKFLRMIPGVGTVLSKLGSKVSAPLKGTAAKVSASEAAQTAVASGASAFGAGAKTAAKETIEKGISQFGKTAVKESSKLVKHAAALGEIAVEGSALGFGAGTVSSIIRGDTVEDAMANGAVVGAEFAAGGMLLYPVGHGVLKIFQKFGRLPYEWKARGVGQKVGAEMEKNSDFYLEELSKMTERTPDQERTFKTLLKMKATGAKSGPAPETEFLKDAAVIEQIRGQKMKEIINDTFLNEDSPMKSLYDSTPLLKNLVDNGKDVEALSVAQTFYRESIKKNKTVQEFLSDPFVTDSKMVYEATADKLLGKLDPTKYPVESRSMIVDYTEKFMAGETTKKDLKTLRNVIAGKDKQARRVFGIFAKGKEKFLDLRLSSEEADQIVGRTLDYHLGVLAGKKTPFSVKGLGNINDDSFMLKTATFMNKQFNDDMVEAYGRGSELFEDSFVLANPKAQDGIKSEAMVRATSIELNNDLQQIRDLRLLKKSGSAEDMASFNATEADIAAKTGNKVKTIDMKIRSIQASISNKLKTINKSMAKLDALDPETRSYVTELANKVYLPTKKQLADVKSNELYARLGWKDSPVYLKASSDLVSMIQSFNYSGVDASSSFMKRFAFPFITNVENFSRIARRSFGYNNPMEIFFRGIKDAEININKYKSDAINLLKPIGIKSGTKESAMLFDFVENKLTRESEDFLKLPADLQERLINGKEVVKGIYDKAFNDINSVMRNYNLLEISKRNDYITHFSETMELFPQLLDEFGNVSPAKMKALNIFFNNKKGDPSKTFMSWELQRTGVEPPIKDAIMAIEKYMGPAAERIYFTPLVRGLDTAKSFATGRMVDFLQKIKTDILLRVPNEYTKSGSDALAATAGFFQRRLAKGALFGSPSVFLQQIASVPLSLAFGGKAAILATAKMFTKESKEMLAMSRNSSLRSAIENVDLDGRLFGRFFKSANDIKVVQAAKTGMKYWTEFSKYALEKFDRAAAGHAFLTGVERGRLAGITDKNVLREIGDYAADTLQASFSRADRPAVMDNPIARAFLQFQSFSMNLGATIMTDLPMLAKQEGVEKAIGSILRTAAGVLIINETAKEVGMPTPFSLSSFTPLGTTFRFGAPGMYQAFESLYGVASGDKNAKQFGKEVLKLGATMVVPGGAQIYKTTEALFDEKEDVGTMVKGAVFGMSTQRYYKKKLGKGKKKKEPLWKKMR